MKDAKEDGPFADEASFQNGLEKFVHRCVNAIQASLNDEIPALNEDGRLTPEEVDYISDSGLGPLLARVIGALRCFHPAEPMEGFLAYALRAGLQVEPPPDVSIVPARIGAQNVPTSPKRSYTSLEGTSRLRGRGSKSSLTDVPDSERKKDKRRASTQPVPEESRDTPRWALAVPMPPPKEKTSTSTESEVHWRELFAKVNDHKCSDEEIVELLRKDEAALVDIAGSAVSGGLTLFHAACQAGRKGVLLACLDGVLRETMVDPNFPAFVTGLSLNAVATGMEGSGEDAVSTCWVTGLELAAAANHAEVCQLLLRRGALVGRALHLAVTCGALNTVTCIIHSFGADETIKDEQAASLRRRIANSVVDGFSPLSLAVLGNHGDMVVLLLEKMADPLQKLTQRAVVQLGQRPMYSSHLDGQVGDGKPEHTVLQLSLRLGVGRRRLWQRMLRHLQQYNRIAEWPVSLDGTLCACAEQALVLSKRVVQPEEIWRLLPRAKEPACATELQLKIKGIHEALVAQAKRRLSKDSKESTVDSKNDDIIGLDSIVELEEDSGVQQNLDSLADVMDSGQGEDAEEEMKALLPWHVLGDREGWDPVAVCGLVRQKLPGVLEGMLQAWREEVDKEQAVELQHLKDSIATAEKIKEFKDKADAGHFVAQADTLGIYFWAKFLGDDELQGILLMFRLHITEFERTAAEATKQAQEKLATDLAEAKKEAESARKKYDAKQRGAGVGTYEDPSEMKAVEAQRLEQERAVREQEARAECMELSQRIVQCTGDNDRLPEVFLHQSTTREDEGADQKASKMPTSCRWRMQACIQSLAEDLSLDVPESGIEARPAGSVRNFIQRLEAVEFEPDTNSTGDEPPMRTLVVRARYFAVGKWATALAHQDDRAEAHHDTVWQAFVIRLWTTDERIPKQAAKDNVPELKELVWYVKRAVECLASEQVTLFTFMPTAATPDFGQERSLRLKEGIIIKESAQLNLPPLATLTADPTVVWQRCQEGGNGIIFKVQSKKAKPSWRHSICSEEREYTLGALKGTKLVIHGMRMGITAQSLHRGLDFPRRTFGASSLVNMPFGVPGGSATLEAKLGLDRVVLVEAEEA